VTDYGAPVRTGPLRRPQEVREAGPWPRPVALSQFIEQGLREAGREERLGQGVPDEFLREAYDVPGHVVSEPLRPAIHAVSQLRGSVVALAEPAWGQASSLVHPRASLEVLANALPLIFAPVRVHEQRHVRPPKQLVTIPVTRISLWQFQPPVAEEAYGRHKGSLLIAIGSTQPKRTLLALPALWTVADQLADECRASPDGGQPRTPMRCRIKPY